MPELQKPKLPHVRFRVDLKETKDEDGHIHYSDVYWAEITPAGAKEMVEKVASEWIAELKAKSSIRLQGDQGLNEYGEWYDFFSKAFERFKAGEEMTIHGTPLRACMAFTKSEVARCEAANVYSLEDLAAVNEQGMGNIGLGARILKLKATEILENNSESQAAEKIAALTQQVEELKQLIEEMRLANMEQRKAA